MIVRSKPKIGCSSSITKRWTHSSLFDVWKMDVWDCSMRNSVNLVMGCTTFEFHFRSFEAKNNRAFDNLKMNTYKFFRWLKIDVRVRSMFDKVVFNTSLMFLFSLSHYPLSNKIQFCTKFRYFRLQSKQKMTCWQVLFVFACLIKHYIGFYVKGL